MTQWGLTPTGFVRKPLTQIQSDMQTSFQTSLGQAVNVLPTSVIGQILGIVGGRLDELWAGLQAVQAAFYTDTATGISLDYASSLTNVPRLQPTYSQTTLRVQGTQGTLVPGTFQASVSGSPLSVFQVITGGTIGPGVNEVQTVAFSAVPTGGQWAIAWNGRTTSNLAYNCAASDVQTALVALSNIGAGNVSVSGNWSSGFAVTFQGTLGYRSQASNLLSVVNSTLTGTSAVTPTVTTTTPGWLPYVDLPAQATVTGPVTGPAGFISVLATPTLGITAVTNLLDAVPGTNIETDGNFRLRRLNQLAQPLSPTAAGIREALLKLNGVTNVFVVENNTNGTVAGQPPNSIQAYVAGGQASAIAATLWATKPGGIQLYGTQSYNITDSQGYSQTVYYSLPTTVPIYVSVQVGKNTDSTQGPTFPSNGLALIQSAVLAYGQAYVEGETVYASALYTPVNTIPGITSIAVFVGITPNPTSGASVVISPTQIALFQLANIAVT